MTDHFRLLFEKNEQKRKKKTPQESTAPKLRVVTDRQYVCSVRTGKEKEKKTQTGHTIPINVLKEPTKQFRVNRRFLERSRPIHPESTCLTY